MLRLFCRLLFHVSVILLFQLAEGKRGRGFKCICDIVSPPNITVAPLKAISCYLECREPEGLISGLDVATVLTEWKSLCLVKQPTSRWTFLWTLVKSDNKTCKTENAKRERKASSWPRRGGRILGIFLPHKVTFQNVLPSNYNKKEGARAICKIHHLCSELVFFFFEEKKSISAKFIHGFLRSMQVHLEGLGGTRFIPVKVFEGELPLMLFSLPLRS